MIMRKRYTYAQFDTDVKKLARALRPRTDRFDAIYGVPRGGLALAVCLSHSLGKPILLDPRRITKRTLVADDIADSGATLKALLKRQKVFLVVTLYRTTHSRMRPDFSCRTKKKNDWVVFPWETDASSAYDGTLKMRRPRAARISRFP